MNALTTRPIITDDEARQTVRDVAAAGRLLCRAQASAAWKLKPDGSFVTALDRQVEDDLRARLLRRFPGWAFIGEEGAPDAGAASVGRPRIILDPIDGTAAFARGLNFFAVSLGLFDEAGRPALAILHLPAMRRFFVATFRAGVGTLRQVVAGAGGITLRAGAKRPGPVPADLRSAYVYLGSDPHLSLDLSRWTGKVRALGATASHLGLLLDHTIDPIAAVVTRYKIWDVAAGLALAEAADLDVRDLRSPRRRLTVTELLDEPVLPPLLVGRPEIVAHLARRVRIIPPRGRIADMPSRDRSRTPPSR
jgi:fructose-1,6-bisphosphatase/inositol monophosphatase family enzyme